MSTYGPPEQPAGQARTHVRCVITKNTKGYQYETSASANYDDPDESLAVITRLLREVDTIARDEIAVRARLDG